MCKKHEEYDRKHEMIDIRRMENIAKTIESCLDDRQLEQLYQFSVLLVEWNKKINLTAITDPAGIEEKHFLDCLHVAKLIKDGESVVDVGSGAGFPGIVIKIVKPKSEVTLLEPTGKRVLFLQEVCEKLGLTGIDVAKERAEEAGRKKWRESFDVATARAVASLPMLCEYCLPLVKEGGRFIAMKGASEEVNIAQVAAHKVGGEIKDIVEFSLPSDGARRLITIEKVSPTPEIYPRAGGVIKKKPLK